MQTTLVEFKPQGQLSKEFKIIKSVRAETPICKMNPLKKTWSLPCPNPSPVQLIKISKPAANEENTEGLFPPHFRPISHFHFSSWPTFSTDRDLFVSGVDYIIFARLISVDK